jgi:hypothetical protein
MPAECFLIGNHADDPLRFPQTDNLREQVFNIMVNLLQNAFLYLISAGCHNDCIDIFTS